MENKNSGEELQTERNDTKISVWIRMNMYAIICAGIMCLSMVLPYVNTFMGSTSLLSAGIDGWFFIIVALAAFAFAFKDCNIGVIIVGAVAIWLAIIKMRSFPDTIYAQKAIGYYLMIVSAVGIFVSGIAKMVLDRKKNN